MNIRIKTRIYWSFSLLVSLFVINGIITILTINKNKKSAVYLSKVVEPSLLQLDKFKEGMVASKMYTSNWVFLRSDEEDKALLRKLHQSEYATVKANINLYVLQWNKPELTDSLNSIYAGFEKLMTIENGIMVSLNSFESYDDPVIKLEAERELEDEVLPRTTELINSIDAISKIVTDIKINENAKLEQSSMKLRILIIVLAMTIICAGFFLAMYMTRIIIAPINKIRLIINDLGKGIIRKIGYHQSKDEIGEMVRSVNNLSQKLATTTSFANEIGNRKFDTWYEPLSAGDTLGKALITMRDNLRTSEVHLEINNKELEQKNKELEQFAYVASHDLQEPLRTTTSFVELLQQQYRGKLDETADKYLNFITQSSTRMAVLIKDLLDYSRIGYKKELEKVDCNNILRDVLADLDAAIKETNAEIQSEPLPIINGYPTEIKQLFQNLIMNAIKFRKKGTIPKIKIEVQKTEGDWKFSIQDNGIGIEKGHCERIFIIFQRLHNRTEYMGSGIGLSHCKKIVELHNGKIWVDSVPGEGSTFNFTIHKSGKRIEKINAPFFDTIITNLKTA